MIDKTTADIINWDIVNWSKALDFWEKEIELENKNYKCLEIGGRKGGLSLWLALKGNNVICSDLESPEKLASEVHVKYDCNSLITYQAVDTTNIQYREYFDIIAFKSILGGISRNNNNEMKKKTIDEIAKALKENGVLLFAENIDASILHKLFRKIFVIWGKEWNYLKISEISNVFQSFSSIKYITVGFWGAFGRNERQRSVLGKFDRIFEKIVPYNKRYILIGIAKK
jgi:hypothetical protein